VVEQRNKTGPLALSARKNKSQKNKQTMQVVQVPGKKITTKK
jgi:hypothetical protein